MIKKALIAISVFTLTLILSLSILTASAFIPREAIRDNMERSAVLLTEREVFYDILDGINASKIDRYADSILLSIAWQYKSEEALESVMWSSYYKSNFQNENENFRESLEKDYDANTQYLRYWHGSAAIIRFLHLFLDLKGIYILHSILLILLSFLLIFLLIKNKLLPLAVGTLISLTAVSVWFVPLSLEYTWCFLLMLVISIAAVLMEKGGHSAHTWILFLISGMLTVYLDFLTAETITLTIPLIMILFIRIEKEGRCSEKHRLFAINSAIIWGSSYVLMWISKWILSAIILKTNTLPYVQEHIEERAAGNIGLSPVRYILGALNNNVGCLFPFDYGTAGVIIYFLVILAAAYCCFVYRRKDVDYEAVRLFLLIALIPLLRFMILRNHSFIHYFFTYRALSASVLSFCISIYYIVDRRYFKKSR